MKSLHVLNGLDALTDSRNPCVATIGNFDGVHRGHEMVIQTLLDAAKAKALPSTVVTFQPLAREFFAPDQAVRLQPLEQRLQRLESLGVDQVLIIEFNQSLASMSPDAFVSKVLVDGLGVQYVSIGDDFKFGYQRQGDISFLQQRGTQDGFEAVAHNTFEIEGERVSSGRVRKAVLENDFELAGRLLGRPYSIAGTVSKGDQRGRTIGFPTANISLEDQRYAVHGVYAVTAQLEQGQAIPGVANVGWRPTVDGRENRLEVHLFDVDIDLYDQAIDVQFVAKIREEKKFNSFEELTQQIAQDADAARAILKA